MFASRARRRGEEEDSVGNDDADDDNDEFNNPFDENKESEKKKKKPKFGEPKVSNVTVASSQAYGKIIQMAISANGDALYFLAADYRAIFKCDLSSSSSFASANKAAAETLTPAKKRLPKAKLLYSCRGASKALGTASILENAQPFSYIWVDRKSNALIGADYQNLFHISPDEQSIQVLEGKLSDYAEKRALPIIFPTTSGRVFFVQCSKQTLFEIIVDGNQYTIQPAGSMPADIVMDRYSSHCSALDVSSNGTMFLMDARNYKVFQKLPGSDEWTHFIGTGMQPRDRVEQRRQGQSALTADIGYWAHLGSDDSGNVVVVHGTFNLCSTPYTNLHQWFQADGKRFETLCLGSDLIQRPNWVPPWAKQILMDPARRRYFVALEENTIYCVNYEIPVVNLPSNALSKLWNEYPELSDLEPLVLRPSGTAIRLHRAILSVRCPSLIDNLEKCNEAPEDVVLSLLRYIYDDFLPSDVENEVEPVFWVHLWRLADKLEMRQLCQRLVPAFGRALFFVPPERCFAPLDEIVKGNDDNNNNNQAEFIEVAKTVILSRPAVVAEYGHQLMPFPELMCWLMKQYADMHTKPQWGGASRFKEPSMDLPAVPTLGEQLLNLLDTNLNLSSAFDMSLHGIPCHRVIMQSRCPRIAQLLSAQSDNNKIYLPEEVQEEAVRRFVSFLYCPEATAEILGTNALVCAQIIQIADFLDLTAYSNLIHHCTCILDD